MRGALAPTRRQQTAHAVRILRALTPNARRRKMPRKRWPVAPARDYGATLRAMTIAAVAPVLARVVGQLPGLVAQAKASRVDAVTVDGLRVLQWRFDVGKVKELIDAAYADAISKLKVPDVANAAHKFALQVSNHNARELGRQLQATFGVPLTIPDARTPATIDAFVDQNVSLVIDNVDRMFGAIEKDVTRGLAASRLDGHLRDRASKDVTDAASSIPSRGTARQSIIARQNVALIVNRPSDFDAQQLAAAIQRNVELGGSTAELANEIEDRFGFAEDHAEFIARDQVGTLNGQLDAQRQQSLGVTRFVWRTAGDERVRDEHEARDGEVYSYDNPPDGELPGEPINCRCTADPVLDDLLEEA